MKSKYRAWILPAIVVGTLLAFTPHAIYRVIKTGNPYLFTSDFFGDMLARLNGPGRFRFVLQPFVAMLLGIRDGRKDARDGAAPFLWGLIFHRELRPQLLKHMVTSVLNLVSVAILLDIILQYLIFGMVRPGAALILGPVLIAGPYSCARALSNRIARRGQRAPATLANNNKWGFRLSEVLVFPPTLARPRREPAVTPLGTPEHLP